MDRRCQWPEAGSSPNPAGIPPDAEMADTRFAIRGILTRILAGLLS
jgi:hypothetical protein